VHGDVYGSNLHAAHRVPDPPVAATTPLHLPPLRQRGDPRLKELIRRNAKEVRDPVHVA
jgi:hypothetical protein